MVKSDDAFLKTLLATFRVEAAEHLEAISSGLLALEKATGTDRTAVLEQIYREAHSLKGAARAVNLNEVEALCHSLETTFAVWKKSGGASASVQFDAVHEALDRIKRLLPAQEKPQSRTSATTTVRIDTDKLDAIMRQSEELLGPRLSAAQRLVEIREIRAALRTPASDDERKRIDARLAKLEQTAEADHRSLAGIVDTLLHQVREAQMLPFSSLSEGFRRVVRDLARDQEKRVELVIEGDELQIDRRILEEMKAPIHHLLRNSVDHGIEKPLVREKTGKVPYGTITIAISARNSRVHLAISDDGAGIDAERVAAKAGELGLPTGDVPALIFQSGLSTSSMITEISGRGLGLAIVREKVESLGGAIAVATQAGAGTTVRIELPLTLATFRGVLIRTAEQSFIIPAVAVDRVARAAGDGIRTVENRETISLDGQTVPLVSLSNVLEMVHRPAESKGFTQVVVLGRTTDRIAFAVDGVVAEQEVLVKNLGPQLARVRNVAGASVLGTGEVVTVLNVADLMLSAVKAVSASFSRPRAVETAVKKRSILVAEDSITSRTLLKNILEAAGYEVTVAVDGMDAWTTLRTRTFDLVVSDVEMPRMDGFDLTTKVRSDEKLSDLPVVLVTALESREHRERGIDVGANAYIVKSSFDQSTLLEVIRRLV